MQNTVVGAAADTTYRQERGRSCQLLPYPEFIWGGGRRAPALQELIRN